MKFKMVLVIGLVVAACSPAAGESTDTTEVEPTTTTADETTTTVAEETTTTTEATAPVALGTAETDRGTVLVDQSGNTLYIFTEDEGDVSVCYDECEANWPVVPAGLAAGELDVSPGSTSRNDGSSQLTINGRPVYLFAFDSGPGDTFGQGVFDVWWVLAADGEPIEGKVAAGETSLGSILVDGDGNTLYIFMVDEDGVSACYDECEANWPSVAAGAASGENAEFTPGFHRREDGSEQLTINGRPVYLFAGDTGPGDVNGQGVGDVWFVIGVDGEPVTG